MFPPDFAALQEQVIDKGRLDPDADVGRVQDWINSAYFTACIETNFYEAKSVASTLNPNDTSALVPGAIQMIDWIVPTGTDGMTWGPMTQLPLQQILQLRAWQGGAISTGAPSRYAFRSSNAPYIEFWPQAVGGEVLTFYGQFLPVPMASDTDTPIFPPPYEKVIEYGALIHACEFKKDLLMMQGFQAGYQDWLARFRGFHTLRAGDDTQQFDIGKQRPWPRRNDVDQGY